MITFSEAFSLAAKFGLSDKTSLIPSHWLFLPTSLMTSEGRPWTSLPPRHAILIALFRLPHSNFVIIKKKLKATLKLKNNSQPQRHLLTLSVWKLPWIYLELAEKSITYIFSFAPACQTASINTSIPGLLLYFTLMSTKLPFFILQTT